MALQIGDNFSYQGAKPLDARLTYNTIAEMASKADSTLYDGIIAFCKANGKNYQWKSTNEVDATLGKWREFESGAAHAGFTPVGAVISVMGVSAPANYLACNGQTVNIADYPELASYFEQQFGTANHFGGDGTTTFAVPDLRGEFLRGTGTNSHENQGSGANVGVHQNATASPVIAASKDGTSLLVRANDAVSGATGATNPDKIYKRNASGTLRNAVATATAGTTSETYDSVASRPTNTSVLYCIATKNIYIDARFDYSTEEKVVGTWIDGKPLYQKTVLCSYASSVTEGTDVSQATAHNISDIDSFVYIEINNDSNQSTWGDENATRFVSAWFNATNIYLRTNRSNKAGTTAYVTVRYTKTTDTAS